MKTADKVTTIRIVLAPVFFAVFHSDRLFFSAPLESLGLWRYWQIPVLWIIFIVVELSDMADGMIARKQGSVSDFGKLYDPFADTIIQITIFCCFVWNRILPVLPFLLILYREFAILFIRSLMQKKGIAMGARMGGKVKTVAYVAAAFFALAVFSIQSFLPLFLDSGKADLYVDIYYPLSRAAPAAFWLAMFLSLLSFVDYARIYRKSMKQ